MRQVWIRDEVQGIVRIVHKSFCTSLLTTTGLDSVPKVERGEGWRNPIRLDCPPLI